jgi:DNA-binding NtrC family response regulator
VPRRILIVDDDEGIRATLEFHLGRAGYELDSVPSAEAALNRVSAFKPDLIITDVRMEGMSGLELLTHLASVSPGLEVIVMTAHEDMRSAVFALKNGAYDYLVKPFDLESLERVLERCFRDRAARFRGVDVEGEADEEDIPEGIDNYQVGRDPKMIEIYKMIGILTEVRAPVLIRGETGTGKEMVARAIHFNSSQSDKPFIAINCTALPETLLESELFGHVRGSFTGATSDRKGRFEMAGSGTIFLDEIGDTSQAFQTKLLRVLQSQEFYPVGGDTPRRTQARIIAATHQPVEQLIRENKFREDLYFRLRVVEITVPPLRERRGDIPLLARFLLGKASRSMGKEVTVIPDSVMRKLVNYDWPGNVRELENAITRAAVMARGKALSEEHLSFGTVGDVVHGDDGAGPDDDTLQAAEFAQVERALKKTAGNKSQAAEILNISRSRLDRYLSKMEEEQQV